MKFVRHNNISDGVRKYQNFGFTLAELLVTVLVFILIVEVVYSAYILGQQGYQEGEASVEITQNGRVILERLTRESRQAKEIVTELPDDETNATEALMFQDGHDASNVHYIRYFKDGTNIKRQDIAYYFAGSTTSVPWDTKDIYNNPPGGSDDCSFVECPDCPPTCDILNGPTIIGEHVEDIKFWGLSPLSVYLTLEKDEKTIDFKIEVSGRNL